MKVFYSIQFSDVGALNKKKLTGVEIVMRARRLLMERERAALESDETEDELDDFQDGDFEDLDLLRISQGLPSPCVSPQLEKEVLPTISELGRQWGSFWKKESATPPSLPTAVGKLQCQKKKNPPSNRTTFYTLEEIKYNEDLPVSRKLKKEIIYNEMKREATPFVGLERAQTLEKIPIIPLNDNHFPEAGNFEFVYKKGRLELVGARFSPDLSNYVMF